MKPQLIVIIENQCVRDLFCRFFTKNGLEPIAIERSRIIPDQQIAITEERLEYCGRDITCGALAAIILDSGYMWPQPVLAPRDDEWERYQDTFDEYLRNIRESSSLWYSMLEIINYMVPLCINPQRAFETQAFKPFAFDELARAGVAVPPVISGNHEELTRDFIKRSAPFILSLPLSETSDTEWVADPENVLSGLKSIPIFLQALTSQERISVISVNGKPVSVFPQERMSVADGLTDTIAVIQKTLHMPLAQLTFGQAGGWVLSDFSPCPNLEQLPEDALARVMAALLEMVRGVA